MASQSPDTADSSEEVIGQYENAWAAIRELTMEQGQSWSGNELNCSFLNTGDGRFINVSAITGAEYIDDARSMVPVDWDNDGDLDMVLKNRTAPRLRVLRNDYEGSGHFLAVDLRATRGHPDAIGASVVIQAGGKVFTRRIYCGDGFLAQRSRRLHFSLGDVTSIDKLTVHWTDGPSEEHAGVALDSFLRLTQGSTEVETLRPAHGSAFQQAPSNTLIGTKKAVVRVPLVEKLPLGPFSLPSFEQPGRTVKDLAGQPTLINLWASWCSGCRGELRDFEERAAELEGFGLQIVPMTTDDVANYPAAHEILEGHGLTKHAGFADKNLMNAFELIITKVIGKTKSAPLPTSFLLDREGQLVAIYLGPVEVDVLKKDLRRLRRMDPDQRSETQMLGGGRWVFGVQGRSFKMISKAFGLIGMPTLEAHFARLHEQR